MNITEDYNLRENADITWLAINCAESKDPTELKKWFNKKYSFVMKDINGNDINAGDKFSFEYKKSKDEVLKLIGSFDYCEEDLRYEIDIHDNGTYVCLSYNRNVMSNFKLL